MKTATIAAGIWGRLAKYKWASHTKIPKYISDHYARDIGMTKAELEAHRFVWPSDSKDRPML